MLFGQKSVRHVERLITKHIIDIAQLQAIAIWVQPIALSVSHL